MGGGGGGSQTIIIIRVLLGWTLTTGITEGTEYSATWRHGLLFTVGIVPVAEG